MMIKSEEFYIPSSDRLSSLHCINWIPDKHILATFQICHGMVEHILRYEEFASMLAGHGIAVIGHDHLGHGKTSFSKDRYGLFADKKGGVCMVKDIHRVSVWVKKTYMGLPHFILGHSMGSFFLRRYLTLFGDDINGALIMGTGDQALPLVIMGKAAVGTIGMIKGGAYRSDFMHNLVLGGYNRSFQPSRTVSDWLSRDEEKVDEYLADPYCSFHFTCSGYHDFFDILLDLKLEKQCSCIPKTLPIYLLSGSEDPVGEFGNGVRRVYRRFLKLGLRDVSMKLYQDSRHELLNEINRESVYDDILEWVLNHLGEI